MKIFLGSVNVSPTMCKKGVTSIYSREYSLGEFIERVSKQEIPIENFIGDDEILQVLKENGLNLPERNQERIIFGVDAFCTYYKVVYDRNDSIIIHRWNFYPTDDIQIANRLED